MTRDDLIKVRDTLNEVIQLQHGKSVDVELWLRLLDARGAVLVELYREDYRTTWKWPEVSA